MGTDCETFATIEATITHYAVFVQIDKHGAEFNYQAMTVKIRSAESVRSFRPFDAYGVFFFDIVSAELPVDGIPVPVESKPRNISKIYLLEAEFFGPEDILVSARLDDKWIPYLAEEGLTTLFKPLGGPPRPFDPALFEMPDD